MITRSVHGKFNGQAMIALQGMNSYGKEVFKLVHVNECYRRFSMCYVIMFRPNKRSNLKPQFNNKNNVNIPKQQSLKPAKTDFCV